MRKQLTAVILGSLVALGFASTTLATKPNPDHKVTICHAVSGKGETKNGYNIIEVDVASIFKQGHDQHEHEGRYDIIPAFTYVDKDEVEHTYPGKGDASWIATGCIAPVVTTTTVQEETTTTTAPEQETTTTTLPEETTTTTQVEETTTTEVEETTTTIVEVTDPPTTTAPEQTTPTTDPAPTTTLAPGLDNLPETGGSITTTLLIAAVLTILGLIPVFLVRRRT